MIDSNLFDPIHQILSDQSGRGLIIGKTGTITYMVKMNCPEAYSMSDDTLLSRHSTFVQAFSHMPEQTFVHKQDVYRKMKYVSEQIGEGYIEKNDVAHFNGREFFDHTCYMGFSIQGIKSLSKELVEKPFSEISESLQKEESQRLTLFLNAIDFALNNLNNLPSTSIEVLNEDQIRDYIISIVSFGETNVIHDFNFETEISCGNNQARIFAITDNELLPDGDIPICEIDKTISRDRSELYMSVGEVIGGIHLRCNHLYNQVIYFSSDRQLKRNLSETKEKAKSNLEWDRPVLAPIVENLSKLEKELIENDHILCHAFYSVMIWDDNEKELELAEQMLRSQTDVLNFSFYSPTHENLAILFGSGIIGATSALQKQYMFCTTLDLAVCLFTHYSNFRNDEEGIWFNDRLYQIPLRKDIWDGKNKRIKARNSVVVAPTGSGKSFFVNDIVYQLLDQGYTVVAVEFGNSFKQLCYLYNDISLHVEYDPSMPLGINPFSLEGGDFNSDKEETVFNLCVRLWQRKLDNNEQTTLRKFIKYYYAHVSDGHSFEDFYNYLKDNFSKLCEDLQIDESYFDMKSFIHVCSEFVGNGSQANLLSSKGVASSIKDKRFIHFELTKIKSNPFVTSIAMSMLFDMINNKILSDPSKKGYIIFDEYAETLSIKSLNPLDVNIHETVAFFYQKIRKENGAVMTIIQSPVQLPNNEYTKGIIANTQLLYVLEGSEGVYDAIKETFTMRNKAHVQQMRSLKNDYHAKHPYSECFIRFGENYAITVRLEASLRKYLAFQTQGEIRAALDAAYSKNGNMQQCIEDYIKNNH